MLLTLVAGDFGVEHVGKERVQHLTSALALRHDTVEDWEGTKFLSADLQWDCDKNTVIISMPHCIDNALKCFNHKPPSKPACAPHPHQPACGKSPQLTPDVDSTPPLSAKDKSAFQEITGSLLFHARAVDNKLLVALGSIAASARSPTQRAAKLAQRLLNCTAACLRNGIVHRKSSMQLAAMKLNDLQEKRRAFVRTNA